jgi:hypothetical protein
LFVSECERGYQRSIYDFDNDLSTRDAIEAILGDSEPKAGDEFQSFRDRVRIADETFRCLAVQGHTRRAKLSAWWHRVIVRIAGQELAADLESEYGVSITKVAGKPELP